MMMLEVVRLILGVRILIHWRHGWEVHCFPALPKAPWYTSSWCFWIFISWESNMVQKWCVAFLDHCMTDVDTSRLLPEWPCRALMNIDSSWWTLSCIFRYIRWFVIFDPSFQQTSYLSLSDWFPRIWHGFSPLVWFLRIPTCSFHDHAPSLSRFPACLEIWLSFWKTWLHIIWKLSWAWKNRPYSLVNWVMFFLKVFLCSQCHTFCRRLSWAFWCLIVLMFFQNDGFGSRNLSTILNFVRAVFIWWTQFCFQDWFFSGHVLLWNWLVCIPELFLASLVWRSCPIFRISA